MVHRRVRLTLEEAALGCTKELRGKSTDPCGVCHGAGHRVLAKACPGCRGSGRRRNAGWFGWGASETGCEACGGSGRAQEPCAPCDGAGKLAPRAWRVSVRIPPGARDGDPLRVPAAGRRPGSGAGPMNLRVSVAPHPIFSLEDDGTLRCELPVDGFAWAAQRPIEVPTLGGLRPMSVPRDQLELRLRGEGFPSERRGPRADLVVRIVPVFPPRLSTDQEILIDQLVAASRRDEGADGRIAAWHRTLRQWERSRVAET